MKIRDVMPLITGDKEWDIQQEMLFLILIVLQKLEAPLIQESKFKTTKYEFSYNIINSN